MSDSRDSELARKRAAQVADEIGHQSGAVGVVAEDVVSIEYQRIYCTRTLGARAETFRQRKRLRLERHGDVGAAPARCDELRYAVRKAVRRREDRLIRHVLPGLTGKGCVDLRGFGVGNRVPEYGVTVGHGRRILAAKRPCCVFCSTLCPGQATVFPAVEFIAVAGGLVEIAFEAFQHVVTVASPGRGAGGGGAI